LDPEAGEAGFFVGADGGFVVVVDFEAELGDAAAMSPLAKAVDDELVNAFAAVTGIDIHEADIGVVGMFVHRVGLFDARVAGADDGAVEFGDEELGIG